MGDLSNFLANLKNYMSLEGEFRCCHLVFGVFCPQIHVFWGPMVKKSRNSENNGHLRCVAIIFGNSWTWWEHCVLREQDGSLRISENDGYIVAIIFGNSRLYVAIIFRNSWKPRKMDLFCGLKSFFYGGIFLFSIQEFIWAGEICQKPHLIWSIWAPRAPFVIYTLIYGVTTLC